MKQYLVVLVAVGAALSGSLVLATPASAAPPAVGGCPSGFELTRVNKLPREVAGAQSTDVNGDGYTCVKLIATGTPKAGGVVVDNASSAS